MKYIGKIKVMPGMYNPFIQEYRHYYNVLIFATKDDMWEAGTKLSPYDKDKGGYGAITIPIWREKFVDGQLVKTPKIGNVLFYKDCLGSECISHEAVHMATSYLRILDQLKLSDQIDEDEEKLAYCIGACTRQIVDSLYKLKII